MKLTKVALIGVLLGHFAYDAVTFGLGVVVGGHLHAHEDVVEVAQVDTVYVIEPQAIDLMAHEVGGDREIAAAILREAAATGMDPRLILGIIRVENPWLNPDTVNWYGAVGLMQVVGWLHDGEYPECGVDLTDISTNVCYGTRIYQQKLEHAEGDHEQALLLYNGCAGDFVTDHCELYPSRVYERGEIE